MSGGAIRSGALLSAFSTGKWGRKRNGRVKASSQTQGEPDPYEVLGINPLEASMDPERVRKAYNKLMKDAEGDQAKQEEIQQAYDRHLYRQLERRQKGQMASGFKVPDQIKKADVYLPPWMPRWSPPGRETALRNFGAACVLIGWAFISPYSGLAPLVAAMALGSYGLFAKLEALPERARFARSLGITFGSTFAGALATAWLPFALANVFKFALPASLLIQQRLLIIVGSISSLCFFSTYFS